MRTRVLIVEDQPMIRHAFERYLSTNPNLQLFAALERAEDAVPLCRDGGIDLVLMDIMTKSAMTGLEATRRIKADSPGVKVVIVTFLLDELALSGAHAAGADSLWYKDADEEELLSVIERTLKGQSVFPDAAPVVRVGFITSDRFTPREQETIRCLVKNMSYADICDEMGITENTLKGYVKTIYSKTGCKDRAELIFAATDSKYIDRHL